MNFLKQTKFGEEGNCFEACLASLLGISIAEIPDIRTEVEGTNWRQRLNAWLAEQGLFMLELNSIPSDMFVDLGISTHHIIIGKSPRGEDDHAVIGLNGKIVHDPHPDNTGLKNGPWLHAFLIRTFS